MKNDFTLTNTPPVRFWLTLKDWDVSWTGPGNPFDGTATGLTLFPRVRTAAVGMITHCPLCREYADTAQQRYPVCNDCWYKSC